MSDRAPTLDLAPGRYTIDAIHTFVTFSARHMVVGRVVGRFDRTAGSVAVARDLAACTVDVTIDTTSVSTQNTVRDEDLRGPSFFHAASFPAATYRGRGIRLSGAAWVMDGALTIRGITKTVPLTLELEGTAPARTGKPTRVAFHATAALQRADFGMTRELLAEIGVISDRPDVFITIDAELLAQPSEAP